MAYLWWHAHVRDVSGALSGVGELKFLISNELTQRGFANVVVNNAEVAGGKDGVWVSIAHLSIGGRRYWEMVIGSGDTAATRGTVEAVVTVLLNMRFL